MQSSTINTMLFLGLMCYFMYYLKKNDQFYYYPTLVSFLFITLLATMAILSPIFAFLLIVFISTGILFVAFPYNLYKGFSQQRSEYLQALLVFLSKIDILDFCSIMIVYFFCVPKKVFISRLMGMSLIILVYFLTSRYYFYHKIILQDHIFNYQFLINFILFLGIATVYYRLLISLSLFFVFSALKVYPFLLAPSILYIFDGEGSDSQEPPATPSPNSSPKRFAFINIDRSRSYYRQHFNPEYLKTYRFFGYGIALAGTGIGAFTLWYTHKQTMLAEQANRIAERQILAQEENNREMRRQNDLEELSQNLLSQDEYNKRYKKIP